MDETMFGGKRPGKRGWGASGKNIVFGIYQKLRKCLLFPSLPGLKRPCNPISSVIPKQGVCTILMTGLPMPFYLFEGIMWSY